jgi:hypothetical protein
MDPSSIKNISGFEVKENELFSLKYVIIFLG